MSGTVWTSAAGAEEEAVLVGQAEPGLRAGGAADALRLRSAEWDCFRAITFFEADRLLS